ncbi:IclR family transcriptional regulator [Roseomonas stagni]|uniref:IclR family transcriptional regulator n=1 Tax=Falsiroseomonas algicola TaxID=2716930 RepID=A0A6M1LHF4_9PROT|nr:IclR family transcriptional regulator [Falsiroseomonas algicola]NGM19710.1 IclR family transcriptional regulator [Falsiroseomonas algicola]
MSDDAAEDPYISPPVQRAARLLRCIAEGDAVTNMARTARNLDISRTTLLRLLRTLEAERFIAPRGGEGAGWQIGTGLIGLAARAFAADDLMEVAGPILGQLAETLGISAHLGVLDGREVVYMIRRTPNFAFASNIRVGSRLPAHAANMGRIILAHLPVEEVRRIFGRATLQAVTAHTPTTLPQLLTLLEADRSTGLAWSEGRFEPTIASVAAVVRDASGAPVAAINVSGQIAQFEGAERRARIGGAVAAAAAEISARLGWAGASPMGSAA